MAQESGKVLLLTTDINVGMVADKYLSRRGFEITHAENEDLAISAFSLERPDLVLIDTLETPRRTLFFLKRLHAAGRGSLPPILMAGGPGMDQEFERDAKEHGVVAFLFEPFFDLPGLAETLRSHLEGKGSIAAPRQSSPLDIGQRSTDLRESRAGASSSIGRPQPTEGSLVGSGEYRLSPKERRAHRPASRRPRRPKPTQGSLVGSGQYQVNPSQERVRRSSSPSPASEMPRPNRSPRPGRAGGMPHPNRSPRPGRAGGMPHPNRSPRPERGARRPSSRSDEPPRAPAPPPSSQPAPSQPQTAPQQPPSGPRLEFRHPPLPDLGDLGEINIPDLLHACAMEKFTGMLMVRNAPIEKGIFIQKGRVVFVESDIKEERFGAYLRRIGRLTQEQYETVEADMQQSQQMFGDILVSKGVVAPNELFQYLKEHTIEKLISCFAWHEGVFALEHDNAPIHPVVPLKLETPRIILDGISRHFGLDLLEDIFQIPDQTFMYIRDDAAWTEEQLSLNTTEARLFELGKRGEMLGGLIRYAAGRRVDVLRLLYALYLMEVIGFTLTPPHPEALARATGQPLPDEEPEPETRGSVQLRARSATTDSADDIPKPPDSGMQFLDELNDLQGADYFKIHGLEQSTTTEAVHSAFRARAKRFHPDKLQKYPTEIQQKGAEVYRKLVEGYRILAVPKKRAQYIRDLQDPEKLEEKIREAEKKLEEPQVEADTPIPTPSQPEITPIERKFQEARAALRGQHIDEGLEKLKELHDDNETNPRFQAWFGWALYLSEPDMRRKLAEKHLTLAKRAAPKLPDPYLLMARLCEREHINEQAKEYYAKATELAPDNLDIAREARLFDIRLRKGTTRGRSLTSEESESSDEPEGSGNPLNQDVGVILKKFFNRKK